MIEELPDTLPVNLYLTRFGSRAARPGPILEDLKTLASCRGSGERNKEDLTIKLTFPATLGQQDQVLNDPADGRRNNDFDHPRHGLVVVCNLVRVQRDSHYVVRQRRTSLLRRPA